LNHFISQNRWDEARVFVSKDNFGDGVRAPKVDGRVVSEDALGNNRLIFYTATF
jgi:diaminohydroxyphosphoribosylaminopyrimidine deaminase/5-amino-6-(5-phosphoribosylamino)uracil reductase